MSESNGYASLKEMVTASQAPRRFRDVVLPVCKLKLKIQSLTEKEKSELETDAMSSRGDKIVKNRVIDARRRLILAAVCEPKLDRSHIEMLGSFDGADLGHLHTQIAAHVGWSEEDIEKLEGKSGTATDSGSPTG